MKLNKNNKPIESKDIKVNVDRLKHLGIVKEEKGYLCNAIGNRGLVHAWGTGPTKEQAEEQCRLAVKESLEENHSKWRHAPFTYVIEE